MLFFLTSILSLTAIAADFIHFRRRRRRKQPVRRALVAWVAATDALPILSSLIGALSRDNGPELMYLYMWLFWAWTFYLHYLPVTYHLMMTTSRSCC